MLVHHLAKERYSHSGRVQKQRNGHTDGGFVQMHREGDSISEFVQMQGQYKAHLQVRDSSLQLGCPVHQIVASVDQSLVMQAHKCLQDRICSDTRGVSCAACHREGTACCAFAAVSVQECFTAAEQADQQM